MKQYIDLCKRVLGKGTWVYNERTNQRCLTVINADLEYDVSNWILPVLTTKKMAWKMAIAEMLGYLRGYNNTSQFHELGCTTWDANAEAEAWQSSKFCIGQGDMGRVYGVQGRKWRVPAYMTSPEHQVDQLKNVYNDLKRGIDNRREIITFYNPGELDMGCLAPCMHTHTFSILDNTLYLTSNQRSCDLPLGVPFNAIQCGWFLMVMAWITDLKPGKCFHKLVNVHIYENQIGPLLDQIGREPLNQPTLYIDPNIQSLHDLERWVTVEDFTLPDYVSHPKISFPFSV